MYLVFMPLHCVLHCWQYPRKSATLVSPTPTALQKEDLINVDTVERCQSTVTPVPSPSFFPAIGSFSLSGERNVFEGNGSTRHNATRLNVYANRRKQDCPR